MTDMDVYTLIQHHQADWYGYTTLSLPCCSYTDSMILIVLTNCPVRVDALDHPRLLDHMLSIYAGWTMLA